MKLSKENFKNYKPSLYNSHNKEISNTNKIRNSLYQLLKPDIKGSRIAEMIEGKRSSKNSTTEVNIPSPLPELVKNAASKNISMLTLSNMSKLSGLIKLTDAERTVIEESTRDQSTNPIWHEQRMGRLTSSKFYKICTRTNSLMSNPSTDPSRLVNIIMGYSKVPLTYAMKHGLGMEPHAKRKLIGVWHSLGHKKVTSRNAGLFIHQEYSHFT